MLLAVEPYLKKNIDDHISIEEWEGVKKIPIFLRSIYKFYTMKILETRCILIAIIDKAPGIDSIQKQIKSIEKITSLPIVLYYQEITRYRRKSLIENKIPFVIEDGQIFLPFLGLHLKNTEVHVEKKSERFTPSAQVAYLYFLYNKDTVINITDFAKVFDWKLMTASRALNELYRARLLSYAIGGVTGKSKYYKRITGLDYFEKGKELLSSPIKKVVYVKKTPSESYLAGLEALSRLSMLNPPNYKIRALNEAYFKNQDLEIIKNKESIEDGKLVELQIWKYNPQLFAKKDRVDTMSLYASLKEEKDERIEQALEEILRDKLWYMD